MSLISHGPSAARTLNGRLILAIIEHNEHQELFDAFTARMNADNVNTWRLQIEAWEKDPTLPDPYAVIGSGEFYVGSLWWSSNDALL